jgi:hypothetical protein
MVPRPPVCDAAHFAKGWIVKILLALLVSLSLFASAAEPPDNRNPLDKYRGDTQFSLLMCAISFKIARLRAEAGSQENDDKGDYRGCIAKGRATAKVDLAGALRFVKKAKAQDALKTYHVAFMTALEGIDPGSDERRISYAQRQQALSDKVNEAWARFEIEQ